MMDPNWQMPPRAPRTEPPPSPSIYIRRPSHHHLSHLAQLEHERYRHQLRDRRKHSDPVRLKSAHKEFIRKWNNDHAGGRINPICVLRARSSAATDFEDVRRINWAFNPKKSRLNHLMIDPELNKLREKYERRIQRRRSLSVANHTLAAERSPKRSAVVEKYERLLCFGRRCVSESTLLDMTEGEIDVDLHDIKQHKRVSFSAPTAKRKSVCPDKPAPILLKEPKTVDTEYPLSHMDYATFRAWRTGETFRQSIDSNDSSEEEPKKPHESALQLVKYLILSCLKR